MPEEARDEFARRIAQAAQQAAPLVLENGHIALLVANLMAEQRAQLDRQLQGLSEGMGPHGLNPADPDEPVDVPVPPQAGDELPGIAEALMRGPLQRANQFENARRANALLAAGDVTAAVGVMRTVANCATRPDTAAGGDRRTCSNARSPRSNAAPR